MNLLYSPALLFTPGNKPKLFEKALASGANGLILELEDAVPPAEKNKARDHVIEFLKTKHPDLLIIVRINHITTDAGLPDLQAFKQEGIYYDAILYPKTESAEELNIVYKTLNLESRNIQILAFIETAKGLMNLNSIVTNAPLAGLVFGAADFAADVGCQMNWDALLHARHQIIQAAALTQIPAIDSPFFDFTNEEQLISEIIRVKELGFKGKLAIHPRQISAIKQNFIPGKREIERAKKIVALFEDSGGKACQLDGQMIDVPVYKQAQEVLKFFEKL
ncbi:CoA ester lyase [Fluoribacter dumoffii]|uniref:Citrate lyase subunit beta n=1 Tax=Fluoribacter dumoffii TaxID=463 RepID=A0A377GBV9_9GAMM|nr:aldolase/citrate lyase family protein [Fluoribacter dumoffii]KTC90615.1 citrate lyase beta subunit [Fluoribacter dumoffii NY 23]MCW8419347.1 CoA ester lyase [Fluoribacter dumoffii]MCW8452778.1 CoA ester lyase [Fluoribacter dumoffii]MCW8459972.1 CoA ester lyase [Fluoribacter dumoffii]MCW8483450.1 CoA ester lyase [Fluoribacter dumoffii]